MFANCMLRVGGVLEKEEDICWFTKNFLIFLKVKSSELKFVRLTFNEENLTGGEQKSNKDTC